MVKQPYDLEINFPGFILQAGIYYAWPYGIRYRMSEWSGDTDFLDNHPEILPNVSRDYMSDELSAAMDTVEEKYGAEIAKERNEHLTQACDRATTVLDKIFNKEDKVHIICLDYEESIAKSQLQLEEALSNTTSVKTFDTPSPYDDINASFKQIWYEVAYSDVAWDKIVRTIAYKDFPGCGFEGTSAEIFFINPKEHVIINMYDDRGLDVIAKTPAYLEELAPKLKDWINITRGISAP